MSLPASAVVHDVETHHATAHEPRTACTNCGSAIVDVFCGTCGERQPDHHDLTVSHFFHDVLHEMLHFDSKIFRTLRLLIVKPGELTAEYFAGRKTRYIAPLRLFLTLFALQFFAFTVYKPVALYSIGAMTKMSHNAQFETMMKDIAAAEHTTVEEVEHRFDETFQHRMSYMQLLNIFGIALVMKILHRKRFFAEHLVFAAHYCALTYLYSLLVMWPLLYFLGVTTTFTTIAVRGNTLILLVYLGFALHRFYRDRGLGLGVRSVVGYAGIYLVTASIMGAALLSALLPMMLRLPRGGAARVPAAHSSSPHAGAPASH
jgi:hypothetical protein